MENREEFIKNLKRGIAGALAGASVLAGATGCEQKSPEQSETSPTVVEPSEGVGRLSPEERMANKLEELNYSEMLNVLKEMYVNMDKTKNPESELKAEDLELYYKTSQVSCFYVESKDAIILNGKNSWETEQQLIESGLEYNKISTGGAPMIIVTKKGKTGAQGPTTIDGIGTIKIGDTNIDEAPITTPELLNTISADGKTTAQEIPQELWKKILETAINYLQGTSEYNKTKLPKACEEISKLIFEYDLQEYVPEKLRVEKTIQNYEFIENNIDNDGR